MAAARKMDELLVSWLGSDAVYESILELIDNYRDTQDTTPPIEDDNDSSSSPREVIIPPFYPKARKRRSAPHPNECWVFEPENNHSGTASPTGTSSSPTTTPSNGEPSNGVRDQVQAIFYEIGQDPPLTSPSSVQSAEDDTTPGGVDARLRRKYIPVDAFVRITKDVCRFPSFFNAPLYQRILFLWNNQADATPMEVVTYDMLEWYWEQEMEPFDASDRFFRLAKQPDSDYISRDDFFPFIHALLQDHPGLEFLSSHAEFQEKYALTVITRIFYSVNKCHSGKITARQIRRSDLLDAFHQVDEEEDINKVTRYLSYEHFYVLYWYVVMMMLLHRRKFGSVVLRSLTKCCYYRSSKSLLGAGSRSRLPHYTRRPLEVW